MVGSPVYQIYVLLLLIRHEYIFEKNYDFFNRVKYFLDYFSQLPSGALWVSVFTICSQIHNMVCYVQVMWFASRALRF